MKEPPELNELVGGELSGEELARLREVDTLLRRVPPPPHEVPLSLTQAVEQVAAPRLPSRRRRLGLSLAFAAVVAALAFGAGRWTGGDEFDEAWSVALEATESAPAAAGVVHVGEADEDSGNMELVLDVSGLEPLGSDEFYALWLADEGEWAATCGYFSVGEGETTVRMSVSYDIRQFDAWVVSVGTRDREPEPLLRADIDAA